MSELIFVRHGQASFGKASYDKLSDRGVEQVKILARHWQALGERFQFIYSGSLLRQRETAQELLGLVDGAPSASIVNPDLNEYNGDPLIRIFMRDHAAAAGFDPDISWPIQDPRLFQRIFEQACALWVKGELRPSAEDDSFETWSNFQERVYCAVNDIMSKHGGGSRVIVSTSGGVIAMALQRVLGFPDLEVIKTNWMVHNSGVSRVRYGGGKMSLSQFNNLAHLECSEHRSMITYR